MYGASKDNGWIMYNDEHPDGKASDYHGHAKGVIFFDSDGNGFWLVHSVPKFPPATSDSYSYPDAESIYGQSFLCTMLDKNALENIAAQLKYADVYTYDSNFPSSLESSMPNMKSLIDGDHNTGSPTYSVADFSSKRGQSFTSFSKNKDFNADLYSKLVAPQYSSDLWIETWLRPFYGSCCKPTCSYNNQNVRQIQIEDIEYLESQDHSKWCITVPINQKNIVCVGGINRNLTQWKRGGGTVCFKSSDLHTAIVNAVMITDSC
jgi:deoxyribonuclease II